MITGALTSKIDNENGAAKQQENETYLPTTELSAVGLSHAGSEYLVMKEIAPLLEDRFGVSANSNGESWWWR